MVLEYMDGGSLADVVQKVGVARCWQCMRAWEQQSAGVLSCGRRACFRVRAGCCARQGVHTPTVTPTVNRQPPTCAQVERIPEAELAGITARILPALAYMHANRMVHRDIKPANILMSTDGQPKVGRPGGWMKCRRWAGAAAAAAVAACASKLSPSSPTRDTWPLVQTHCRCPTSGSPHSWTTPLRRYRPGEQGRCVGGPLAAAQRSPTARALLGRRSLAHQRPHPPLPAPCLRLPSATHSWARSPTCPPSASTASPTRSPPTSGPWG